MKFWRSRGLTVLAIAGVAALVLVADTQSQIANRVDMAQSHFAYAQAYELSRQTLADNSFNNPAEQVNPAPGSSGAWIAIFKNQLARAYHFAPEGGPAFILNKHGSTHTGAIGVTATNFGRDLILARPAYKHLTAQTATVRQLEILSQVDYQATP